MVTNLPPTRRISIAIRDQKSQWTTPNVVARDPAQTAATELEREVDRHITRRSFQTEVWGGDIREGKTSNIELDAIYRAFLPADRIVPSDTMVCLNSARATQLAERVRQHGVVYFPIFIKRHWIAGILQKVPGNTNTAKLTTHDSAPSPVVEQQLRSIFGRVWPTLRVVKGRCPRQQRYSDDCGLYMSANFLRHHLDTQMVDRRDLPACLRRLLYATKAHAIPQQYFLDKMTRVLNNRPASRSEAFYAEIDAEPWQRAKEPVERTPRAQAILGGGGRRTNAPVARKTARTPTTKAANKPAPATPRPTPRRPFARAAATQAVAERRPQATPPTRQTRSTTRTRTAAPVRATAPENTTATRPDTMVPDVRETADAPRGQPVDGWAAATLTAANGHARAVYEAMNDHLWAATALAMCGDGVARGLGEVAIGMRRVRHQLPRWQPYSVQEMLKLLGKTVHVLDAQPVSAHSRHGTTTLCLKHENGAAIVVPDPMVDEYYLVRGPALPELPPHVMGYRFVLGARLREAPCDMNGGRQASYYELVPDAAGATVGMHIPEAMTHYAANKAKRASHRTQRYTPVPRSQPQPQQTGEDTDAVATMSGKRDGWLTRHAGMAKDTDGMEADDETDDNGPSSDDGQVSHKRGGGRDLPTKLVPIQSEAAAHIPTRVERRPAGHPHTSPTLAGAHQIDAKRKHEEESAIGVYRPHPVHRPRAQVQVGNNGQGLCRGGRCPAQPPAVLDTAARYTFTRRPGVAGGVWSHAAVHEGVGSERAAAHDRGGGAPNHRPTHAGTPPGRAIPRHDVGLCRAGVRHRDSARKGRDDVSRERHAGSTRARYHRIDGGAAGEDNTYDATGKGCQDARTVPRAVGVVTRAGGHAAGTDGADQRVGGDIRTTCGHDTATHCTRVAQGEAGCTAPVGTERSAALHGGRGGADAGPANNLRSHQTGHPVALSWVWPAADGGGRSRAGRRQPCAIPDSLEMATMPFHFRSQESSCASLGIEVTEVARMVDKMTGYIQTMAGRPDQVKRWPLHLKRNTPLDMAAVLAMPTRRARTHRFLERVQCFLDPHFFSGLRTSRTIKKCALTGEEIAKAVEMGKFEPCPLDEVGSVTHLPDGVHGVNVFTVPELKGRRRLITEPLLNRVIPKHHVPRVHYNTRLARRQSLRYAHYMLQIDFEAYYDAIPIPATLRNKFVFRAKHDGRYYRLRTLPTGARWSVAVGQAVTWTIVDIQTTATVITLMDNILIAAHDGEERVFVAAVRSVVSRIAAANLMTSPSREELADMSDAALLQMACGNTVFLGEEYRWNGHERVIRNSVKTVAKLQLALRKTTHTIRSLASLISLIFFALHTTQLNSARAFTLLRAYRGIFRLTFRGFQWDSAVPYVDASVWRSLQDIGGSLVHNPWCTISDTRHPTMNETDYDAVCFTDASLEGWGAVVHLKGSPSTTWTYRQRWTEELEQPHNAAERARAERRYTQQGDSINGQSDRFYARHSAHAEPCAAQRLLKQLVDSHHIHDGQRVALVTYHRAIVIAQKHLNGYGGIGRGYSLNRLYEYAYDLWYARRIDVVFFYIEGDRNPADTFSRNFGVDASGSLEVNSVQTIGVPFLRDTWCPLCEEETKEEGGEI